MNEGQSEVRRKIWRAALLLPGETCPVESGLRELSEYFGISREEALRSCETALADSKREWEMAPRLTHEQTLDFYRQTRSYLFEHIWWHATDCAVNSANVEIMGYAVELGVRDYLDFGSGVGANAILFATRGFNVTLADVSPTMLNFARWRLTRRGLSARFLDLNAESLPEQAFDLISAVDVCEHLYDPRVEFKRIRRALKGGAVFVFNCRAGFDEERPMHLAASMAPIWRGLSRSGLREVANGADELNRCGFFVTRKEPRGVLATWRDGLKAELRFSKFLAPVWRRGSTTLDRWLKKS